MFPTEEKKKKRCGDRTTGETERLEHSNQSSKRKKKKCSKAQAEETARYLAAVRPLVRYSVRRRASACVSLPPPLPFPPPASSCLFVARRPASPSAVVVGPTCPATHAPPIMSRAAVTRRNPPLAPPLPPKCGNQASTSRRTRIRIAASSSSIPPPNFLRDLTPRALASYRIPSPRRRRRDRSSGLTSSTARRGTSLSLALSTWGARWPSSVIRFDRSSWREGYSILRWRLIDWLIWLGLGCRIETPGTGSGRGMGGRGE